jgi:hypothetical protein
MGPIVKIFWEILLGIFINIFASYLIFPRLLKVDHESRRDSRVYYNRNDIYIAVYFGLILSAIELAVVFIGVLVF